MPSCNIFAVIAPFAPKIRFFFRDFMQDAQLLRPKEDPSSAQPPFTNRPGVFII